jgi:ubiquinone/menaquinone biosynthesis C-methylase UbiE
MSIGKQYNIGDLAKKYALNHLGNLSNDLGRVFLKKQIGQISKNKKILDIGCGTGFDLQTYRNIGFSKLYGIDISEKSLDEARKNLPNDIELKIGTFEKIPYKETFFDIVVSRLALHYSKNIELSIKEAGRVLKKGGKFIVIISHPFADSLEQTDNKGNVLISLFDGDVHITFPLHKIGEYFSESFFEIYNLNCIYEFPGNERDGKAKNISNTLGFIATKK